MRALYLLRTLSHSYPPRDNLDMAISVITGASTGIGREFASICAERGYDLVLVARSAQALEDLASGIREKSGRNVRVIALDLSAVDAPPNLWAALSDVAPDIEILINNAGFGLTGFFSELDAQKQMEMIHLNIGALSHLTRLFLPSMIARRRGYILNVASTAAFQPGPLMAVYFASKAYVVSFSEALHNEVRDHGVIVTTLCPGPTRTEFQSRAGMDSSKLFSGPNVMDAGTVAEIGLRAMLDGRSLVVAGRLNALMVFLTRFAPRQLAASMARKLAEHG
jgi:short-subunit dehydrogenase